MNKHVEQEKPYSNSEEGLRRRVRRGIDTSVQFITVSPQLHLLNVVYSGGAGYAAVESALQGNYAVAAAEAILIGSFVAINERKAVRNLKKYRRVKNLLSRHGWDDRTIKPMMNWWCDRYTARRAAIETGNGAKIDVYYKDNNRSWFKIYQK
jgi:hypothetical protein